MAEPIPVIPLDYAKPSDEEPRVRLWRRVNRIALTAGAAVSVGGWAVLLFEVETVLATGPTLFVIGVILAVGGLLRRRPWVWALGLAHCGVCILFVSLVNLLGWSPRAAELPFALMGGAYNLLTVPAAVWTWMRRVD